MALISNEDEGVLAFVGCTGLTVANSMVSISTLGGRWPFRLPCRNGPNAQKDPKNNCTEGSSQPMIFPSTWELCFQMFPNSAMTSLWWTECVLGAIWTTQSWPTFREMWPFAMNCFHSTLIADWRKPLSRIKLVGTQNVVVVIAKIGLEAVYRLERLSQKAMYNCHES